MFLIPSFYLLIIIGVVCLATLVGFIATIQYCKILIRRALVKQQAQTDLQIKVDKFIQDNLPNDF